MGEGKTSIGDERWYLSFFFSKLAGGASSPLVPLFVISVLGGGVGAVSIAVVSVSVATVPAFVLWGEYTDREARRKLPLVVGLAMTAMAFIVMAMAPNLLVFIGGHVLYGLFLAATVPTSTVLIMERNPEPEWGTAVGRFSKINGIGWMVGMAAGAIWFALVPGVMGLVPSMRTFMLLCGLLSAIAYAMAMAWISEPRVHLDRRWLAEELVAFRTWTFERARHIPGKLVFALRPRVISKARAFLPGWGPNLDVYLAATFVLFVGIQVFYVPFPVMLANELAMSSARIFLVYLASAVASASLYAWAGREVDVLGNRRSQLLAWGARAVLFPAFSLALLAGAAGMGDVAFILVMALNAMTGAFFAMVSVAGITTALDLSPRRGKGEAVGAYNAVTGLGMIVGGLVGGAVAGLAGYMALALATGAIMVVAVLLLLRVTFAPPEST